MTLVKICSLILFYFLSRVAFSAECQKVQGFTLAETVCWNNSFKGWISEKCSDEKVPCEARSFLTSKKPKLMHETRREGQNPAAMLCHDLKLGVVVLKDSRENEQSYCIFKDSTLVSSNAIEGFMK
jgi:hypothetical protein